ncbi:hypothetical protein ACRAWD_27065 [Caulobacter segnis]
MIGAERQVQRPRQGMALRRSITSTAENTTNIHVRDILLTPRYRAAVQATLVNGRDRLRRSDRARQWLRADQHLRRPTAR